MEPGGTFYTSATARDSRSDALLRMAEVVTQYRRAGAVERILRRLPWTPSLADAGQHRTPDLHHGSQVISRMASWVLRHRRLVIGTWCLLFAVTAPFAWRVQDVLKGASDGIPGSQSVETITRAVDGGIPAGTLLSVPRPAEERRHPRRRRSLSGGRAGHRTQAGRCAPGRGCALVLEHGPCGSAWARPADGADPVSHECSELE